jgi:hypothetical protein
MKIEFRNRWLRLLVEILPARPEIRRYRVAPGHLERQVGRLLWQRISRQARGSNPEATP